jgi:hypothetical protein
MQANISVRRILLVCTSFLAIELSVLPAQAQLFCPRSNPIAGSGLFNGVCGNPLEDTFGQLGNAFSTSALSSQSLSEVSQTVTNQSTYAAFAAVKERRDQETAPSSLRPTAPAPRPPTYDPKGPVVFKATPSSPYAGSSYAVWGHGLGDWERRDEDTVGLNGGLPNPININRKMTTVGVLGGADVTYRTGPGVWMFGLLGGYTSSNVKLTSSALGLAVQGSLENESNASSFSMVHATISGPSIGAYANYANGPWSADLTIKADFMVIDELFNDSYINPARTDKNGNSPFTVNISGAASVNMINITVGGNLNYRIPISPTHWWEPTGGFRYTRSEYGSNAAEIGLADGDVFRVQGGIRFGWDQYSGHGMWQTTLTGLAYSDVSVNGLVLNTGGFAGSTVLPSDEGKVRGMGILATKYNNGAGTTLFGEVDVRGGQNLFGVGGRLGARISLN